MDGMSAPPTDGIARACASPVDAEEATTESDDMTESSEAFVKDVVQDEPVPQNALLLNLCNPTDKIAGKRDLPRGVPQEGHA